MTIDGGRLPGSGGGGLVFEGSSKEMIVIITAMIKLSFAEILL